MINSCPAAGWRQRLPVTHKQEHVLKRRLREGPTSHRRVGLSQRGCLQRQDAKGGQRKKIRGDSDHQPCRLASLQAVPQRIEHPTEGGASAVWLPCILFQLHSECQAPLYRAASRSSWRQEPTPAGTEAGSQCGLAGLLHARAGPPAARRAASTPQKAGGAQHLKVLERDARAATWGTRSPSPTATFSRLCFWHVLVLVWKKAKASSVRGLSQKYQVRCGEC